MHKIQNKIFNHRLTKIWIASYICVLVLPIVMGIVSYVHTLKVLSSNIDSTNLRLLNNSKTFVDSILGSITNASSALQQNTLLLSLNNTAETEHSQPYTYEEKESIWSAHNVLSGYIANKYVYFPQKDLIYYGDSTIKPHYLYLALYSYNGEISEEQWFNDILNYTNSGFVQLDSISNHPKIFHVSPVYYSGRIIYTTVVEMNWTALCNDAAGDYASNFFMNAYNYNTFYSNMDDSSIEAIKKTTNSARTFNITTVNDRKFIVLKTISSNGNWFYGFSIPASEYYNIITQPVIFSFFIYLLTILLGLLTIIYLVYRNSLPIKRIVKTLKNEDGTDGDTYDAYSYIENKITSILKDKSIYFEQLGAQTSVFKNLILSNMLTKKSKNKNAVLKQLEILGINSNYDTFYTVAFCYDNASSLFFDDPQPITESRKHEYAQFIISNIFSETLNDIFNTIGVIVSNTNIFLIKAEDCDYDTFTQKLRTIVNSNVAFIKDKFGFNVYTAVSSTPVTIDNLNDSYTEVIIAMQYAISSERDVVHYNQIPSDYIRNLSIPHDFENSIAESIRNENYAHCKKIIYKALYDFQLNKNTTIETTQIFAYNILSTVFNLLSSNASYDLKEFIANTEIHSIFENNGSASSILLQATTIIDKCFAHFEKDLIPVHHSKNDFYQKLKKYIDENYTNPDLHSVSLGETFDINSNYMSTQFKKEFGVTIASYITTLRIENAKRLLLTTNLTNEEISNQVGFSNCRTFLRVFKKTEDLTPKEFKRLNSHII